jgi:hypothetical protein
MAISLIETASLDTGLVAPTATALTTASGSAPSYSARAWVNFDGTGTVAIRASGNVTSITDNGTGDYTVNFTTAMPDANYCTICSGDNINGIGNAIVNTVGTLTTTARRVFVTDYANTSRDDDFVQVAIFR